MKKIIYLLLTILIQINTVHTNPIVLPQAIISEFMFKNENEWVLEIIFNSGTHNIHKDFDSICVETSSGISRIKTDELKDSTFLFVISSDSLVNPLSIIKSGDRIKLYSYLSNKEYSDFIPVDSLDFGNSPGSIIDTIPNGYSVCRLWYFFSKDKSPTIGVENDTSGTTGTLKGFMYDKRNNLITSGNFLLENNPFIFENNGKYSTRIYSMKKVLYSMENFYQPNISQGFRIDTLKININPGTMIEKDIHVLDELVNVNEIEIEQEYEIRIINYPNPFNSTTNFFIKIPESIKRESSIIEICNSTGQFIKSISVNNMNNVHWDGKDMNGNQVSSGIYYYRLNIGIQIVKSGSMILLK